MAVLISLLRQLERFTEHGRLHPAALAADRGGHPGLIVLVRRPSRQIECARLRTLLSRAGEAGIEGNINFA